METPPPFAPPEAPRRKSRTGLWIFIILGVLTVCCGLPLVLGVGGALWGWNKTKNLISCAMGFDQARKAIRMYANAHGGNLPNAKTWQDDVRPYFIQLESDPDTKPFKSWKTFEPSGEWFCTDDKSMKTGISFNAELSGKKIDEIPSPHMTVLLFEVDKVGKNLADAYKSSPNKPGPMVFGKRRSWITMPVKGASAEDNFTIGDEPNKSSKDSSEE